MNVYEVSIESHYVLSVPIKIIADSKASARFKARRFFEYGGDDRNIKVKLLKLATLRHHINP